MCLSFYPNYPSIHSSIYPSTHLSITRSSSSIHPFIIFLFHPMILGCWFSRRVKPNTGLYKGGKGLAVHGLGNCLPAPFTDILERKLLRCGTVGEGGPAPLAKEQHGLLIYQEKCLSHVTESNVCFSN
jgi:hypothetical protein